MKERPILFSAPMVRAILAGTKTQTRRTLRCRAPKWHDHDYHCIEMREDEGIMWPHTYFNDGGGRLESAKMPCPYGTVGDRLWVRESCWLDRQPIDVYQNGKPHLRAFFADGVCRHQNGKQGPTHEMNAARAKLAGLKPCPSIHMPRWASRITLEITGIRVQRLHDISQDDAKAEGITHRDSERWEGKQVYRDYEEEDMWLQYPKDSFRSLWRSINGHESWQSNPWVWVVEFKHINQPVQTP